MILHLMILELTRLQNWWLKTWLTFTTNILLYEKYYSTLVPRFSSDFRTTRTRTCIGAFPCPSRRRIKRRDWATLSQQKKNQKGLSHIWVVHVWDKKMSFARHCHYEYSFRWWGPGRCLGRVAYTQSDNVVFFNSSKLTIYEVIT
jgi:hypothetical protein